MASAEQDGPHPGLRSSFTPLEQLSPLAGAEPSAGQPPGRETVRGIPLLPLGTVQNAPPEEDDPASHGTRNITLSSNASHGYGLRLHDFAGSEAFAGATQLHRRTEDGIVLSGVKQGSEAWAQGLRMGDILLEVDNLRVTADSYDQVVALLRSPRTDRTSFVVKSAGEFTPRPLLTARTARRQREDTFGLRSSSEIKSGNLIVR